MTEWPTQPPPFAPPTPPTPPRGAPYQLYVGLNGRVVAIDAASGQIRWSQKIAGSYEVVLLVREPLVFATCNGEIWALDAANGRILWFNKLEGCGYGVVTMAVNGAPADVGAPAAWHAQQSRAQSST